MSQFCYFVTFLALDSQRYRVLFLRGLDDLGVPSKKGSYKTPPVICFIFDEYTNANVSKQNLSRLLRQRESCNAIPCLNRYSHFTWS